MTDVTQPLAGSAELEPKTWASLYLEAPSNPKSRSPSCQPGGRESVARDLIFPHKPE